MGLLAVVRMKSDCGKVVRDAMLLTLKMEGKSYESRNPRPIFVVVKSLKVMFNSLRPMNCSMSGFPVLHYLRKFVNIHVH